MHTNKTRLAVISGATLALVVASTAAVAAHPGNDRERGFGGGQGKGQIQRGMGMGQLGDRGALRGGMLGGLRGMADDFERREVTLQTADGTTVHRTEQGTVDSASDASLTFSLASGESVTVTIDDDTNAVAFSEQEVTSRRGLSRTRLAPAEVEMADIEAGAEIVVWSDSEDGAEFVAQRIVIQPEPAADDAAEAMDTEEAASDESASAPVADA